MAKKSSLVDKALEVTRKTRVPKKPVKTKGKKTVPAVLDWGSGIPEDKLAYLNDDEMALVQANRMFKGKRSHKGVPAFPDPGDTAAGASKSTGPDRGPTGGPSRTSPSSGSTSGLGGGGKGGPSSGGAGTGSGGQSSPSGGQSSPSASSDKGGQKATPSGGPTGGSLSAPARTEPSRGATPPSTFGPRTSSMPGTPVSTAQPSMAYQGAVDRIARGSSVIGGSPSSKIQDRVPQAQPTTVSFSQAPTVGPNRGLGGLSVPQEDYTVGANSPFASPGLAGYDREIYNKPSVAPSTYGNILGPSVPAGTAIQKDPYFGPEQVAARFRGNPTAQPVSYSATDPRVSQTPIGAYPAPSPVAQDPSLAGRALDAQTLGEQLAFASRAAANTIGDYIGSTARNAGDYVSSLFGGSPTMQAAAVPSVNPQTGLPYGEKIMDRIPGSETVASGDIYKTPTTAPSAPNARITSRFDDRVMTEYNPGDYAAYRASTTPVGSDSVVMNTPYGPVTQAQFNQLAPVDQQRLNSWAQSYAATAKNPFNKSPAEQAMDVRRAVSLAQGQAPAPVGMTPASVSVNNQPEEYSYTGISPSQGDYSPSQAPAYDVSPSQQSGMTTAQRDAYLNSIVGDRTGRDVLVPPTASAAKATGASKEDTTTRLPPLPPWQDYSYLSTNYPPIAYAPSQRISDFNAYNMTFNKGGRVGDSVDAAIRLARHGIVSRAKTR